MVTKFNAESFDFLPSEKIPEHTEGQPSLDEERDPAKWHVDGFDTFDNTPYAIAVDVEDLTSAILLQTARKRLIERTQPTEHSGGQHGIQDKTVIRYPTEGPNLALARGWD